MNTVTYAKFTGPNGIFDRFDRDRNGLDENELRAASRDASVYTDKDLSASLLGQESAKKYSFGYNIYDSNRDGRVTVSELKKFYDNTIEGRQAAKARRGETTAQTQKATAAAPASATSASTSTSGAAAEKQPQTSTSASQQPTIDWMALMAAFMQIAMGGFTQSGSAGPASAFPELPPPVPSQTPIYA
ncbi:MAG: hypothetical protein IPK79_10750 [Vampirovibrionales bacterium]|nr:hypothetical protein [Vampirovibrionales bacterium]